MYKYSTHFLNTSEDELTTRLKSLVAFSPVMPHAYSPLISYRIIVCYSIVDCIIV